MHHRPFSLLTPFLLFILTTIFFDVCQAVKPKNAILLSEVDSLTLRGDKHTTHRRVSAVPQLKCISPRSICNLHKIDVMRCKNSGSAYDTEDIQWTCTASLPPELKLGSTDVICEGYANSKDPYVLKGSCGVEYRLIPTEQGQRKFPDSSPGYGSGPDYSLGTEWSLFFFGILTFSLCAWVVWKIITATVDEGAGGPPRRDNGGGGWGGGGGGGGGWDDPPPPYPGAGSKYTKSSSSTADRSTAAADRSTADRSTADRSTYRSTYRSTATRSSEGWRPGFWSGLAGGAAAGYYAGNRNRGSSNSYRDPGPSNSHREDSGSSSAGSSSSSTARYESTGFGSTSRR